MYSERIEVIDYDPFDEVPDELIELECELYGGYPGEVIARENIVWELEPLMEELESSPYNLEELDADDLIREIGLNRPDEYRIGVLAKRADNNFVFYSRPFSTDNEQYHTRSEHVQAFFEKFRNADLA